MELITQQDLILVNNLYKRKYSNNTILSNATEYERSELLIIRRKLKSIAHYFANYYQSRFGPFEVEMSTGNPVAQSSNLNNVWAGLFKGNTNKQYAAQISFVINRSEACLDVGFYFGRASARSLNETEKKNLERQLQDIGRNLSLSLENNKNLEEKYNLLFDFGFNAYIKGESVTALNWRKNIAKEPNSSQIVAKIYPNNFNVIEKSEIDSYVAQVIFLMGFTNRIALTSEMSPALTTQQYIKKAQRFAEIGLKGELHILQLEHIKLKKWGYLDSDYPRHVALESNTFGFDILSKNEDGEDIYIEVKTTTRAKEDIYSRSFFMTSFEFQTYERNKSNYKLARVYNVENVALVEYIDLEAVVKKPDCYIIEY
jgi:hypothetical protein